MIMFMFVCIYAWVGIYFLPLVRTTTKRAKTKNDKEREKEKKKKRRKDRRRGYVKVRVTEAYDSAHRGGKKRNACGKVNEKQIWTPKRFFFSFNFIHEKNSAVALPCQGVQAGKIEKHL